MPIKITTNDPIKDSWLLFHQTFDSLTKCEETDMTKCGLSLQQYHVLNTMMMIRGPVKPSVLADWLDRNPVSITFIIDRMEKQGLVERVKDLKDRRAYRLVITPKGMSIHRKTKESSLNLPRRILSVLSLEELAVFSQMLDKIRQETYKLRNVTEIEVNR